MVAHYFVKVTGKKGFKRHIPHTVALFKMTKIDNMLFIKDSLGAIKAVLT
jgi:hypothetical protein